MKGLRKLSAVALSAAMAAALGTPVFAAGVEINSGDSTAIVDVKDANDYLIATTDMTEKDDKLVKTVLGANSYNLGTTLNETEASERRTVTLNLAEGDVKNLTATVGSGDVTWYLAGANNATTNDSSKKVKDVITVDNGTIKVASDALGVATAQIYVYSSDSVETDKDTKNTSVKDDNAVEIDVNVVEGNQVLAGYENADEKYKGSDNLNGHTLPDVTNTAADLKNDPNKLVNHVDTKESAEFTASFATTATVNGTPNVVVATDGDYNNALKFAASIPVTPVDDTTAEAEYQNAADEASKFVKVEKEDKTNTFTVTNSGSSTVGNGLVWLVPYISEDYAGPQSMTVYASNDTSKTASHLYVICNEVEGVNVYRMYNPNSSEHFYTTSATEANGLVKLGWDYEGVGWVAPSNGTTVYRLYNANGSEHHYTSSEEEVASLVAAGWTNEGMAFYSASDEYVPIYREYNPNEFSCNHNYSVSLGEHLRLTDYYGWKSEGKVFYAAASIPSEDNKVADADALADKAAKEAKKAAESSK